MRAAVFVFCLGLPLAGIAAAQDSINCRFIGNWPFGPSYTAALDTARALAFVGSGGGVCVLNDSVSGSPVKVSEIATRGMVLGLCYANNRLYVADWTGGLLVISVSDPAHPTEVGYCTTPGYAMGVAVANQYAYVADGDSGLRVVSVADPAHPQEVGHCGTPDAACGVDVSGQ